MRLLFGLGIAARAPAVCRSQPVLSGARLFPLAESEVEVLCDFDTDLGEQNQMSHNLPLIMKLVPSSFLSIGQF